MVRRCIWIAAALGLMACDPTGDGSQAGAGASRSRALAVPLYRAEGQVLAKVSAKETIGPWLLQHMTIDRLQLEKPQKAIFAGVEKTVNEVYRVRLSGRFEIREASTYIMVDDQAYIAVPSADFSEMIALLPAAPPAGAKIRFYQGTQVELPVGTPDLSKAEVTR